MWPLTTKYEPVVVMMVAVRIVISSSSTQIY